MFDDNTVDSPMLSLLPLHILLQAVVFLMFTNLQFWANCVLLSSYSVQVIFVKCSSPYHSFVFFSEYTFLLTFSWSCWTGSYKTRRSCWINYGPTIEQKLALEKRMEIGKTLIKIIFPRWCFFRNPIHFFLLDEFNNACAVFSIFWTVMKPIT